jgi:hypothetical protein
MLTLMGRDAQNIRGGSLIFSRNIVFTVRSSVLLLMLAGCILGGCDLLGNRNGGGNPSDVHVTFTEGRFWRYSYVFEEYTAETDSLLYRKTRTRSSWRSWVPTSRWAKMNQRQREHRRQQMKGKTWAWGKSGLLRKRKRAKPEMPCARGSRERSGKRFLRRHDPDQVPRVWLSAKNSSRHARVYPHYCIGGDA